MTFALHNMMSENKTKKSKAASNEFEVEAIVEKRVRKVGGQFQGQYLIKWVGYPESDNTWESKKHLTNCKDLLEKFESRLKAEKRFEDAKKCFDEAEKRIFKAKASLKGANESFKVAIKRYNEAKEIANEAVKEVKEAEYGAMEAFENLVEAQQILVEAES